MSINKHRVIGYILFVHIVLVLFINILLPLFLLRYHIEFSPLLLSCFASCEMFFIPFLFSRVFSTKQVGTFEFLKIKKVSLRQVLFSYAYMVCILPILISLNYITSLSFGNEAVSTLDTFKNYPFWVLLFVIGIVIPISEEVFFRGFLLNVYEKNTNNTFVSMILTSTLFGFFHFNINQFSYALVFSCFFIILNTIYDSILPSIIIHITINSFTILLDHYIGHTPIDNEHSVITIFIMCGLACLCIFLLRKFYSIIDINSTLKSFEQDALNIEKETLKSLFTRTTILCLATLFIIMIFFTFLSEMMQ